MFPPFRIKFQIYLLTFDLEHSRNIPTFAATGTLVMTYSGVGGGAVPERGKA